MFLHDSVKIRFYIHILGTEDPYPVTFRPDPQLYISPMFTMGRKNINNYHDCVFSYLIPYLLCCCLPCNHCSNWTWVVEEILPFGTRMRCTHCRVFNYLKLCRSTYFIRTTQLLPHPGHDHLSRLGEKTDTLSLFFPNPDLHVIN